ncbi:MAG TPA: metallophosphoesterase [Gemmatimonadaceae bacterium]|nr:metallophosphoesterase [Gemmatimonadaceae bacterium]
MVHIPHKPGALTGHNHRHTDVPGESELQDNAVDSDGLDRRNFLSCMAWVGTGLLWTVNGGVPRSSRLGAETPGKGQLFFMQISDSHIGFDKAANTDVTATLRAAIAKINALPTKPAFLLHTGDITQLSKPSEFDTADQVLREARTGKTFYVPGEHDVSVDGGASYLERYGKGTQKGREGGGWYSFDHSGVHFIGLVNVLNLKAGGLGSLGGEQLAWIERDVKHLSSSTPIVVFAHVPLWSVYPAWGWGTDDGARALSYLKRFGSVTVLNGHIHQTMQKVEGNVAFHTALSTAFPQPRPGTAPSPGPMVVPAGQLADVLGVREVHYVPSNRHLAVVDHTLSGNSPDAAFAAGEAAARAHAAALPQAAAGGVAPGSATNEVTIDNFAFTPKTVSVAAGSRLTWRNRDDVPHKIQSADNRFVGSPLLDTKAMYSVGFPESGEFPYFCSLHPVMQGKVVVTR